MILRVRESNRRQGGAALESVIPRIFALRRFREGGRLKRGAAAESIPPQGSQRSRECDQCQVGATLVFASYCISIYFLLNGRKVIT